MPRARSDAARRAAPAPRPIDRRLLRGWPLPEPDGAGGKRARGLVLVIGGAHQMPGPVILAATAALRAGAGVLQVATVDSTAPLVAAALPEALVHALPRRADGGIASRALPALVEAAGRARAILIGPGVLEHPTLGRLIAALLATLDRRHTAILDAGALSAFAGAHARLRACGASLIATPHAGEMARLLGRDEAAVRRRPGATVVEAATALGAVALLKGAETLVSDGAATYVNRAGNSGLATSGSGDVLAGLIAGLAARGAAPLQAAAWGVHLHALAGDALARRTGPLGYLARELAAEVPALMWRLARRA